VWRWFTHRPTSPRACLHGQATTFIYDTGGQRLIRKAPTSVTLYLGKQELKLDRATNKVSATRYYTAGGDGPTIAARQGATLT